MGTTARQLDAPRTFVFVLPGTTAVPVGGFKVIYEYANVLVGRGHRVLVVHPWSCDPPATRRERWRARLWALRLSRKRGEVAPWFEFDPKVELSLVGFPAPEQLPLGDANFATAWQTAGPVAAAAPPGTGFYLIQHLEEWDDPEVVRATWRLPLHKVVIAGWLAQIAGEMGEGWRTSRVPNGLDFDSFGVDVPPAGRPPRVGALISRFKSAEDVVGALVEARRRVSDLTATTYGTAERPELLPDWVEYTRLPAPAALRALYNSCSIFLQASRSEGWGLPATEAMVCGCALVTYDNGGSREYAADGETAMVVANGDVEGLAGAIVSLCRDRELRLGLVERGRELVGKLTWSHSADQLECVVGAVSAAEVAGE